MNATNGYRLVVALCFVLLPVSLRAQASNDTSRINENDDELLESLLDPLQTETDNAEMLDVVEYVRDHPLDLNTASAAQLAAIPRVTPDEVAAIIKFRTSVKRFTAPQQLALIPEVGERVWEKAKSFVFVEPAGWVGGGVRAVARFIKDLQPRKGFREQMFAGSPLKNYTRITVGRGTDMSAGALFEKDAGERLDDGFISGYIVLRDVAFLSNIVLGDYVVEAGQGLVLWRSSAFGKGAEPVVAARRVAQGVQPYRSADEFHFLRGGAATASLDIGTLNAEFNVFSSRRALSASTTESAVESFYEEGLFRTDSERARKSAVVERLFGTRATLRSEDVWTIGTTFYRTTFDKPMVTKRLFEFEGPGATAVGVDGELAIAGSNALLPQARLFWEIARAGGNAALGGLVVSMAPTAHLAVVYRSYAPTFFGIHAHGFGEGTDTKNERGFYFGVDVQPIPIVRVSGYLDHYTFPWRTFTNPLPASGRDVLVNVIASPTKAVELALRYIDKLQETTETAADSLSRSLRPMVDRRQRTFRLTAIVHANNNVRLKGRVEATTVSYPFLQREERGVLSYSDIHVRLSHSLTTEVRLIVFHTPSYDSRVYEYENDLRGVFSNTALYGKGWRWYMLLRWKPSSSISLSAKYAETRKDGVTTIGSGVTEILGDVDNRLAFQLEVTF